MMWTTRLAYVPISGLLLITSFGTGSGHAQEPILLAEQAKAAEAEPPVVKGARMEFVAIPPGEFTMGCLPGDTECDDDEKPSHRVRITQGFDMGKYEVTQAQWEAVMGSNPSHFKGADRPVERVSWNEIQEYLGKLNAGNDGYRYRLPTEAEWEYAARAGTTGTYAGQLDAMAWYGADSGGRTHPVGQKQPNAWGLYDMRGNVNEWCQDWYDGDYYGRIPASVPGGHHRGSTECCVAAAGPVLFRGTSVRRPITGSYQPSASAPSDFVVSGKISLDPSSFTGAAPRRRFFRHGERAGIVTGSWADRTYA